MEKPPLNIAVTRNSPPFPAHPLSEQHITIHKQLPLGVFLFTGKSLLLTINPIKNTL